MIFRRKMYSKLESWKKNSDGKYAVLIEGARRVGKSTVVKEFVSNEYESYILIDFSKMKPLTKKVFEAGLEGDVNRFLIKLQLAEDVQLTPRKSAIIFDEVQKCPKAREMIKHLVADGRFDYIETGSLISLKRNTASIMIPSEESHLTMYPMDFEEYLWAKGKTQTMEYIKDCFEKGCPVGEDWHKEFMKDYREYMAIGGMPQVVDEFLNSGDLRKTEEEKRNILALYHDDIRKIPSDSSMKIERIFDTIPSLLSKTSKIFSPNDIKENSRTRAYYDAIDWLRESKIVNICTSSSDPSPALKLSLNDSVFKCYLLDTGLLTAMSMALTEDSLPSAYQDLILGKLSVNEGMYFENAVAQELTSRCHELIFSAFNVETDNRRREIDFLISRNNRIIPIEVKSSYSFRHRSLDVFLSRYKSLIDMAYVVHTGDLKKEGKITYIPIYMAGLI